MTTIRIQPKRFGNMAQFEQEVKRYHFAWVNGYSVRCQTCRLEDVLPSVDKDWFAYHWPRMIDIREKLGGGISIYFMPEATFWFDSIKCAQISDSAFRWGA